jgi:(1->4)-alpha-D-glucan 1-alpha-D-glucosylmutase
MRIPSATYRLQLNPSFGFQKVKKVIPYLHQLGISDIYASPVFKAVKGSSHGYDIVDPNELNPELGSLKDFIEMMDEKQKYEMGWLQDFVPNHMAFSSENRMLMDLFENGRQSRFFDFFDIAWDHPDPSLKGKVLVPVLGRLYDKALEEGKIRLELNENGFHVRYYEYRLPLCLSSYSYIIHGNPEKSLLTQSEPKSEIKKLRHLGKRFDLLADQSSDENRHRLVNEAKQELWSIYNENGQLKDYIDRVLNFYNGKNERKIKFQPLKTLLHKQYFNLALWKKASEQINYRRFFYLNEFIGLKVEKTEVFEFIHQLIFSLVQDGKITGLRIDHVDGLYDPTGYLARLREKFGDTFIIVEKILEAHEKLFDCWPVQGTTGYEFANRVNGLFCRKENEKAFSKTYKHFTSLDMNYDRLLYKKKKLIIRKYMTGDVRYLAHTLKKIEDKEKNISDADFRDLENALIEIIASFPVYRTYINNNTPTDADKDYIRKAIASSVGRNPRLKKIIETIGQYLIHENQLLREEQNKNNLLHFIMKFQQLTAPATAKGFEDTFLYCYNRLISLNEVGSQPNCFGISVEEFHKFNRERAKLWRYSLNATSTHDTKRGEDVRARINILSEIPEQWNSKITFWNQINEYKKTRLNNRLAPDANDEYFLYQTLIGALPFREAEYETFKKRIKEYFIKAVREAKVHTSWTKPDENYEKACEQFIDKLLVYKDTDEFWKDFIYFQKQIASYAVYNSLSQVLIKMTAPGIPDFYQGSELWELNLVDPDNRRLVDFEGRAQLLAEIKDKENQSDPDFLEELFWHPKDGHIKLFLTYKLLSARKMHRQIFEDGDYLPIDTTGSQKEHVIAFARRFEKRIAITIATRFFTSLINPAQLPTGEQIWEDTKIILPESTSNLWLNAITGQEVRNSNELSIGYILKKFPVALFVPKE